MGDHHAAGMAAETSVAVVRYNARHPVIAHEPLRRPLFGAYGIRDTRQLPGDVAHHIGLRVADAIGGQFKSREVRKFRFQQVQCHPVGGEYHLRAHVFKRLNERNTPGDVAEAPVEWCDENAFQQPGSEGRVKISFGFQRFGYFRLRKSKHNSDYEKNLLVARRFLPAHGRHVRVGRLPSFQAEMRLSAFLKAVEVTHYGSLNREGSLKVISVEKKMTFNDP